MPKLALVGAVLVAASVLGLWWRARNGRFRATSSGASLAGSLRVTVGQVADPQPADEQTARTRSTRDRSARTRSADVPSDERLTRDDLGVDLGVRATFVQLSAEVCSACRSTARVLSGLVAERPDVVHVELDVADHLDLVRRFSVLRTPTTLVLDHAGVVVGRMTGGTDRRQALTALESCPDVAPAR